MVKPTILKPTIYKGNGIYKNGGGNGGYKPQGTYNFNNLININHTGNGTITTQTIGSSDFSKVQNPDNLIYYLLNDSFQFKKITLSFERIVNISGSVYLDFSLVSTDDEILITRPNSSVGMYKCQQINVPNNITYTLNNGTINSNGGKDFICSNSTYANNVIKQVFEITKNNIKVTEQGRGVMGTINKGLNDFIGFKFDGANSGQVIGIANISLIVEQ